MLYEVITIRLHLGEEVQLELSSREAGKQPIRCSHEGQCRRGADGEVEVPLNSYNFV